MYRLTEMGRTIAPARRTTNIGASFSVRACRVPKPTVAECNLQANGNTVGVISHAPAMQERIPPRSL